MNKKAARKFIEKDLTEDLFKAFLSNDLFIRGFETKKSKNTIKNTKIHDFAIKNKGEIIKFKNKSKRLWDAFKKQKKDDTLKKDIDLIIKRIQYVYNRWKAIDDRNKKYSNCNWEWLDFFEWWCDQTECYYCGTSKEDYYNVYCNSNKIGKFDKGKLTRSKKASFNSFNFEIDRKNPSKEYNSTNCVLACHLCNNARSDMIHSKDFQEHIGPGIRCYIKHMIK